MDIKKILFIAVLIFLLASCKTTEKFSIYAPTGTKIFTPDNPKVAHVIPNSSDRINLELPSNMYCGYVMAQSPGSDLIIPMGVDYTINRHTGTKAALYTGATCMGIGVIGAASGLIMMLSSGDDDDSSVTSGIITGIGAGMIGLGGAFGMPAQARIRQTAYDYNFGYEKNQRIKIPVLYSTLSNPNPPKAFGSDVAKTSTTSRKKASSGKTVSPASKAATASGSKVSKNRSDNARKISGKYSGSGSLLRGKEVDESYSSIEVVMERIDKNHVSVRIIESGEDYFDSPLVYQIQKGKSGGYVLSIDKLPEATIRIMPNGGLTFNHAKVNIDNVLYTLKINAEKAD